jgi:hypothetical protein
MPVRCTAAALVSVLFAATDARSAPDFPANLLLQPALSELVMHMHRNSPTFRDQCRLIRGNRLIRVRVETLDNRSLDPSVARADCQMRRYEFGRIEAVVRVPSSPDAPKLIAHELEHVLEFTERLNYRALAILQPAHVWKVGPHQFETRRAIEAGERVAREITRGRWATEQ